MINENLCIADVDYCIKENQFKEKEQSTENSRLEWLDSFRGFLIYLVVLGHLISGENSFLYSGYGYAHYFIYSSHMALFFISSGFLNKKRVQLKKSFIFYILPYCLFDFSYVVWEYLRGYPFAVYKNILFPSSVFWFILGLTLTKILVSTLGNKKSVFFAITLLCVCSIMPEKLWDFIAIGRIALLLPAFLIGMSLKRIYREGRTSSIIYICFGLASIAMELFLVRSNIVPIIWSTHDYETKISLYWLKQVYICIFSPGIFLLASVLFRSRIAAFFKRWGKNSVIIYLIHPFIVDVAKSYLIPRFGVYWAYWSWWMWIAIVLGTMVVCELLSLEVLHDFYNYFFGTIEKMVDKIFRVS